MTIIAVSTAQELMEALESANGGDRIELAAGDYGDLKLQNVAFDAKVTITSADPDAMASFNTVDLYKVKNLAFDEVYFDFHPTAETLNFHSALRVTYSESIGVTNSLFEGDVAVDGLPADTDPTTVASRGIEGYPVGRAAVISWTDDVTFSGNEVTMFRAGISVAHVDGLTIDDNDIHHIRTTAVNGGAVTDVVLTNNHVHEIEPWAPLVNGVPNSNADHADFVHIWTIDGQDGPNENIYIANNFFELGTDGVQHASVLGIYLDDNGKGIGHKNILIENNVLHDDALQGIVSENAEGMVIRNNTFLQSGGEERQAPGIVLRDGTRDVIVDNNILSETSGVAIHGTSVDDASKFNITITDNLQVQRFNAEADNYFGKLFVNALTPNGDLEDFMVIPGSAADGVGARLLQHDDAATSFVAIDAASNGGLDSLTVSASVEDLLGGFSNAELNAMTVTWDFGDGKSGTGIDVAHTYAQSGSYKILGTVTAPDGTQMVLNKVIEISTPNAIDIRFDTDISDLSDIENGVTVTGNAKQVSTAGGHALKLEDTNARVKFDVNDELSNNPSFTFSFDFKYDDDGQSGYAIYFPGTAIMQLDNGELKLISKTNLNENITIQSNNLKLDDSNWHRVSYVLSQATGTATLYIDGSMVGNIFGLEGIQPPAQSHGLTLGSPFGKSFTGQLDNVSFLRAALSEDDIDLFHGETPVSLSDLVGIPDPEVPTDTNATDVSLPQNTSPTEPTQPTEPAQDTSSPQGTQEQAITSPTQPASPAQPSDVTDPSEPTTALAPVNQNIDTASIAKLNPGIAEDVLQEIALQFASFTTSDEHHSSGGWLEWASSDGGDSSTGQPVDAVGIHLLGNTSTSSTRQQSAANDGEGEGLDPFLVAADAFDFF